MRKRSRLQSMRGWLFLLCCALVVAWATQHRPGYTAVYAEGMSGSMAYGGPIQRGELPLVRAEVYRVGWRTGVGESQQGLYVLEVVVRAIARDPDRDELHRSKPLRAKHGKPGYMGKGKDTKDREMLRDPKKRLLLYDLREGTLFPVLDPGMELRPVESQDAYDEQGWVLCRYEFQLDEPAFTRLMALRQEDGKIRMAYTGNISIYEEEPWSQIEHGSIVFDLEMPEAYQ